MAGNVLIVDDNEINLKTLRAKLEHEYYVVSEARDGDEAIDLATKERPDIILMDAMMPNIDGFTATRKLKRNVVTLDIPIIVITALNSADEKMRGLRAGADDFLSKPINYTLLFARMKSLLKLKSLSDAMRTKGGVCDAASVVMRDDDELLKISHALFVDDSEIRAKDYCKALKKHKLHTTLIFNINDVIPELLTNKYNLCIVNTLINGDNLSLCSKIINNDKLSGIPLLIALDITNEKSLSAAFEIGIHDYISTPINYDEMMARCLAQIRRRYYNDSLQKHYMKEIDIDSLTGLYSKKYIKRYVNDLICKHNANDIGLLIIDLNNFKRINDTYGHIVGDEVLKEVGYVLLQLNHNNTNTNICHVADSKSISARIGGDEFVVVLHHISNNNLQDIANTICNNITTSIENILSSKISLGATTIVSMNNLVNNGNNNYGCSIGGVIISSEDDDYIDVLRRADVNLYTIKDIKRNNGIKNVMIS